MVHLGQLLVDEGLLMPEGVQRALERQRHQGGHLGTNLLEEGVIAEEPLLTALGKQQRTPTVSARDLQAIPLEVLRLLPPELATRRGVVPFLRRGRTLYVASITPGDVDTEDEISRQTSCLTRTCIGLELRVREALDRYYGVPRDERLVNLAEHLRQRENGPRREPSGPVPLGEALGRPLSFDDLRLDSLFTTPDDGSQVATPTRHLLPLSPLPSARPAATAPAAPSSRSPATALPSLPRLPPHPLHSLAEPLARLHRASEELERPQNRDHVSRVLLQFCAPYFRRRLILVRRGDRIVGWRGEGSELDPAIVGTISLDGRAPSVFFSVSQGAKFWLGPLPRLPVHESLVIALRGDAPAECLVLPILLRDRVHAFLYVDNLTRSGLRRAPLTEIRRLVHKVGLAYEVCVLQSKIRRA